QQYLSRPHWHRWVLPLQVSAQLQLPGFCAKRERVSSSRSPSTTACVTRRAGTIWRGSAGIAVGRRRRKGESGFGSAKASVAVGGTARRSAGTTDGCDPHHHVRGADREPGPRCWVANPPAPRDPIPIVTFLRPCAGQVTAARPMVDGTR